MLFCGAVFEEADQDNDLMYQNRHQADEDNEQPHHACHSDSAEHAHQERDLCDSDLSQYADDQRKDHDLVVKMIEPEDRTFGITHTDGVEQFGHG